MDTIQAFILPTFGLLLPIGAALFAQKVTPSSRPTPCRAKPAVIVPAELVTPQVMAVMAETEVLR